MPPYPNLVPTSELAQETVELARRFGGRVPALVVTDQVLQIRCLDAKSATALVQDLIADDPRLRITGEGEVELIALAPVDALLEADDFVVVDVETTGARTPHCRITEIGAYRIKRQLNRRRVSSIGESGNAHPTVHRDTDRHHRCDGRARPTLCRHLA